MIRQFMLFTPTGLSWTYRYEPPHVVPEDNDMTTGFFAAIKMFTNNEGGWENNIEFISWTFGYTVFSSCEGKFTLAIGTDKKENVEQTFILAEKIRERFVERWYEEFKTNKNFFSEGVNLSKKIIPCIEEVLQTESLGRK